MEEKLLYPIKFCTLQDDYCWGSEVFKIADLGYRDSLVREGWLAGNSLSEVMDTYIERVVGDRVFDFYGRQFPICVRELNVNGKYPLVVNPDDEVAADRYDFLGKQKLWYVVSAGKNAQLAIGFRKDSNAGELYDRCSEGNAFELLNIIPAQPGQCFHIAPGTPHAAFGELQILEIGESSPLDFCLCSWGQELSSEEFDPQLGLVEALDFISYKAYKYTGPQGDLLCDLNELSVRKLIFSSGLRVSSEHNDGFVLYSCVKGGATIEIEVLGQTAEYHFSKGETMLVPADCPNFNLIPDEDDVVLLESYINRVDVDKYIDPNAEDHLDDDEDNSDDLFHHHHDCNCGHVH